MWDGHVWRVREPIKGARGGALSEAKGQSPWSGGRSPPEAENLLAFGAQRKHQISFILRILQPP